MFSAAISSRAKVEWAKSVGILSKDKYKGNLPKGNKFCSLDSKNGAFEKDPNNWSFETYSTSISTSKKEITIDFNRPSSLPLGSNLELKPGQQYLVFMSFYIGKDTQSGSNFVYSNAKKTKYVPVYDVIYLQKFEETKVAESSGSVENNPQMTSIVSATTADTILGLSLPHFILIITGVILSCCISFLIIFCYFKK